MTRLRDHAADLAALVSDASEQLGLPIADVEKDFWVVELLRSVERPIDGGSFVFKGGTSLSKAYELIERFSEDVDILVVPIRGLSKRRRRQLLKAVAERVAADLELKPKLIRSTDGTKRHVDYEYDASFPDPGRLKAGVKLEMDIRGGPEPCEAREVVSYVATAAAKRGITRDEFEEFAPVTALTLKPERTLVEKLSLLHSCASRLQDDPDALAGQGRHVYDVYCLLRADSVREAIRTPDSVAKIAADSEVYSGRFGNPVAPRPGDGFAASPAWGEHGDTRFAMERSYEATATLVWGRVPTFEQCLAEVIEMRAYL